MALHVVGHDGTDRGDDAVALARRLSGLYEAELLAVHVVGMPPTRDRFTGPVLDRLEDAAGVVLARARRGLEGIPGPAPRAVHASSPAAGLQAVCEAEGAGLVTVGPTHRGPVGRVLAGTTAERLLSGAPCPVALAPNGYAKGGRSLERVVVGYDGGEEAGLALKVAAELASLAGVGLRVVVVAEPASALMTPTTADLAEVIERSAQEHAEQLVAEGVARITADIVVERDIVRGEPGSALASAARATRDLLVVGSRRYGPVRSVLVGTVGHHLAHSATCPVLIVPRGVETGRAGEVLAASTARR